MCIYIHVVIYVYIYIRVYAGYSYTYVGLLFCVYICAHSFRLFLYIAPLKIHYSSEAPPRHSTDTMSEFHTEAPQATTSERRFHGPYIYVAATVGCEPATLRTKGAESTNEPPRPTCKLTCM